jgi:hypothetical protein
LSLCAAAVGVLFSGGNNAMPICIACACGKQLLVKDELEGKQVRCPACRQPVLVQRTPAASPKRPQRQEEEAADEGENRPGAVRRTRKKARRPKAASSAALWIGIGGGAALLVAAAVVLVIVLRSGKQDNSQAGNARPVVAGPGNPTAAPQGPQAAPPVGGQKALGAPFLDQQKEIPPRLEWNREVVSRKGGTIAFRVTSEGPFSVTVLPAHAYQALMRKDQGALRKEDVLLMVESPGPALESEVTIPPGSSYFIIENRTDKAVRMHLQCYDSRKPG